MKAVTDTRYYDEIAKRIHVYGNSGPYTPAQMPAAIDDIVSDARKMGEHAGYQSGYGSGYAKGEAQGRQDMETEILGGAW